MTKNGQERQTPNSSYPLAATVGVKKKGTLIERMQSGSIIVLKSLTEEELNKAKEFIAKHSWTFAKTYAEKAPHEYLVKTKIHESNHKDYEWFVALIKKHGYKEKFWSATYTYLRIDEFKYWTMEKSWEVAILINRAK